MTFWTPTVLQQLYPRQIVGFDLRVDPDIVSAKSPDAAYTGTWNDSRGDCWSLDDLIWRRIYVEEGPGITNGLGLYDTELEFNQLISKHPEQKIIAAFDLPVSLLAHSAKARAINTHDLSKVSSIFEFCGYDIAGWDGHFSALYSFDWNMEEMCNVLEKTQVKLNKWGLVNDEGGAIRASVAFSEQICEHAPFAPFGVWAKKSIGNDYTL